MGRPRKQTVESEAALPIESLVNDGLQTESEQEKEKEEKQVTHIKMVRDPKLYPEPHTADVHVTMVEFYSGGGWVVLKE